MKAKTLTALAGLSGALIMSGESNAAYLGLTVQLHSTVTVPAGTFDVYRVYGRFDAGDDRFYNYGGPTTNQVKIQNFTGPGANDPTDGSGFFNPGVRATSPQNADMGGHGGVPARRWDTFVTVGVWVADEGSGPSHAFNRPDQTAVDPTFDSGFPGGGGPVGGNSFSASGAVFAPGEEAFEPGGKSPGPQNNSLIDQNRADYAGDSDDIQLWVPLLQLTVLQGEHVRGTLPVVQVALGTDAPGTQPATTYDIADITAGGHPIEFHVFNSIPAPGALALLGLAGLVGTRRRR